MEDSLTETHVPGDVIIINGHMDKHEKFSFVRLLTRDITLKDYLARIYVVTAAANTGIDQKWMEWIDRIGLPQDALTVLQEMRYNARLYRLETACQTTPFYSDYLEGRRSTGIRRIEFGHSVKDHRKMPE